MQLPPHFIDSLHSAPAPLAWCDQSLAVAFRTDSWMLQFQPGSEHVELAGSGAGRVLGRTTVGDEVAMQVLASPSDSGFWLQLVPGDGLPVQLRALQEQVRQLERQAFRDTLTGLWNRRFFDQTVDAEMARAERHRQPLSLLFIDVDRFKHVNDEFGHAVGDQVLQAVATILSQRCRAGDRVVRWGGDEFAVLATFSGSHAVALLAEDLRRQVDRAEMPAGLHVTLSIGGAQFLPGESQAVWFDRADAQVYLAKEAGRNAARVDPKTPPPNTVGMLELVWREEYACGNAQIDQDHERLLVLANRVLDTGLADREAALLLSALDRLLAHVVQHFANEEAILHAKGYPHAEAHARAHARLVERAVALRSDVANGQTQFGVLAEFLAREVVVKHMVQTDRDFYAWVVDRPVE